MRSPAGLPLYNTTVSTTTTTTLTTAAAAVAVSVSAAGTVYLYNVEQPTPISPRPISSYSYLSHRPVSKTLSTLN